MSSPTTTTTINADTTYHRPTNHSPSELVVLCTWLGASEKHISKYLSLYASLTPSTPILLIQSHVGTITRPYPTQRKLMKDCVGIVQNVLSPSKHQSPKILIHTFSNGGSNSATQLLLAYHEETGQAMPLQGMICDSGPARGEYWKSWNSMVLSMPPMVQKNLALKLLGGAAAHFILLWMGSNARLGRYPIFEVLIRDTLLDPDVVAGRGTVGGEGKEVKRRITYIWSKEDEMVHWEDVVSHAEEAEKKGWEVGNEEFVGSGHCGHLRVDGRRYEGVCRGVWEA